MKNLYRRASFGASVGLASTPHPFGCQSPLHVTRHSPWAVTATGTVTALQWEQSLQ